MRKTLLITVAFVLLAFPVSALADTVTFTSPTTAANNNGATDNLNEPDYAGGNHQFDLDHQRAYTWQINNIPSLAGQNIVSATLTFRNIANWDTNPNMLFVHLLNSANAGFNGNNQIASVQDATGSPVTTISDYFSGANTLGPGGANNTFLFARGFNMVGQGASPYFAGPGTYVAQDYVFTFNAAQLAALQAYINSGQNIAFAFDPDCHFWNNGIVFSYTTAPNAVPEPMSMALLGTGLAGLYLKRRRRKQS